MKEEIKGFNKKITEMDRKETQLKELIQVLNNKCLLQQKEILSLIEYEGKTAALAKTRITIDDIEEETKSIQDILVGKNNKLEE